MVHKKTQSYYRVETDVYFRRCVICFSASCPQLSSRGRCPWNRQEVARWMFIRLWRLGPEQSRTLSLLRWDLCVRTRTHEPQSVLPLASRTPPAHVYPQTQPKLFVSEALFSSSLAPQPSFRQINIAPEIAGISGIFERSRWKGGES